MHIHLSFTHALIVLCVISTFQCALEIYKYWENR